MKLVKCLVLINDSGGKTEWRTIPWGKRYLDKLRTEGTILMSFIEYHG